jgi:hypothetical protein
MGIAAYKIAQEKDALSVCTSGGAAGCIEKPDQTVAEFPLEYYPPPVVWLFSS